MPYRGLTVNVGAGANSSGRKLNIDHVEEATFAFSSGVWIDRDGALLFSATWDHKTDRRLAIDVNAARVREAKHADVDRQPTANRYDRDPELRVSKHRRIARIPLRCHTGKRVDAAEEE